MKFDNYEKELTDKIIVYTKRYDNKYIVYFKTIIHCFTKMLNIPTIRIPNRCVDTVEKLPDEIFRIAVRLEGGLGDIIVYSLWVKEFSKFIKEEFKIDVFPSSNTLISKAAFKEGSIVNKIYNADCFKKNIENYDIAIAFRRFPYIVYYNNKKLTKKSANLQSLIDKYNQFQQENMKFFTDSSYDTLIDLYSICRGEKRIQQPDIGGLLHIDNNTKLYLPLKNESFEILDKYNLKCNGYITLTRSIDLAFNQNGNIRLWPLNYYEELIIKLKKKYPDIKFVQLGVPRCEEIKGVDVNLLGKTDLEEVKAILKHSLLHIDGECGMVHVKHFLHGKSVVLFGQTAIEYLGYDNNINLKSNACSHLCEWIADDWQTRCIRGYEQAPCMVELKPQYVFEKIVSYLDSVVYKCEKHLVVKEYDDVKSYFIQNHVCDKRIVFYGKEFYDIAKTVAENNNTVAVYDEKLDNALIHEARNLKITVDYGDIYNIPEENDSIDIFVCNSFNNSTNEKYALEEIKRVAGELVLKKA